MSLKTLIMGEPGMKYRIRVFDNGHFIKQAEIADRGQEGIDLIVKKKDYMILGEEVKLRFMINPLIKPFYFGNIMEINFDIRNATQLADLFEYFPDIVKEINRKLYDELTEKKDGKVIDAQFTVQPEDGEATKEGEPLKVDIIEQLTDPEPEDERSIAQKAIERASDNIKAILILNKIRVEKDSTEKSELIRKAISFAEDHPHTLNWLPRHIKIEPEVMAVVGQTELDGVGIDPMYYIRQSKAEISEKMLHRPKAPDDWKTLAIMAAVILGVMGLIAVMLYILTKKP